ncbi:WXG100 family type VII secretion target [Mycolicibacterium porcinum]|nr:WXG100 family type VII secretion target [Mycolicibacterium porcinum]
MSDGSIDYNFNGIEGDAGDLMGAVAQTQGHLDEGQSSLATLTNMWEGEAKEAWLTLQTRWDQNAAELNAALKDLSHAISEAGQGMASTEAGVAATFGG